MYRESSMQLVWHRDGSRVIGDEAGVERGHIVDPRLALCVREQVVAADAEEEQGPGQKLAGCSTPIASLNVSHGALEIPHLLR